MTCPKCGYCKHCGRANPAPYRPWYPNWPYWNYPTYGTITVDGSSTIGGNQWLSGTSSSALNTSLGVNVGGGSYAT